MRNLYTNDPHGRGICWRPKWAQRPRVFQPPSAIPGKQATFSSAGSPHTINVSSSSGGERYLYCPARYLEEPKRC